VELLFGLQEEIKEIDDSITKAEAELLQNAPDNIRTLYLRIDFLCCKQSALRTHSYQHLHFTFQVYIIFFVNATKKG